MTVDHDAGEVELATGDLVPGASTVDIVGALDVAVAPVTVTITAG